MISIIIPTYKNASYLIKTLDNIFNQTFQDFEIIIVDDGLTVEARKKIESYLVGKNEVFRGLPRGIKNGILRSHAPSFAEATEGSPSLSSLRQILTFSAKENKIKLLKQEPAGAPTARNRGFGQSKGEFLFFCDDDIILKKDALEKMIKTLNEHSEASYVYCGFYLGWKIFPSFDFDAERLKKMSYICGTSLIRREHFPGWDESLKKFQDWDLWLTMLEKGYRGYHLSEILFTAIPQKQGMSAWLPSFIYKIPWRVFPFKLFTPRAIKKYQEGVKLIQQKHKLNCC